MMLGAFVSCNGLLAGFDAGMDGRSTSSKAAQRSPHANLRDFHPTRRCRDALWRFPFARPLLVQLADT
jgi:hypothetical protein